MTGTRLPAVRIPQVSPGHGGDEESVGQESVIVDLAPSNKFGFAWPTEQPSTIPIPLATDRPVSLSSSDGETDMSEEEVSAPSRRQARPEDFGDSSEFTTPTNNLNLERNPLDDGRLAPPLPAPRLSRAFSMPLPSQLGSLLHPRRPSGSPGSIATPMLESSSELEHFRELSLELADSVQMVIQTLLQLSPPQVLDPVKEQFSACSLSIPTPSISAMFTSMKNLNYMSANMSALSMDTVSSALDSPDASFNPNLQNDFDVGEMLQSVGDALGGVSAHAGVDLVLFHGDIGLKHISVKGDENGLSYTLSHVIRQVIACSKPGDTVEVGLYIETSERDSSILGGDTSFTCSFHILQRFTGDEDSPMESRNGNLTCDVPRPPPAFDTLILRRLLRHIGASLRTESGSPDSSIRSYEMSIVLEPGAPSVVNPTVAIAPEDAAVLGYPDMQIANEPSLDELVHFAETLRGKSVTLHASTTGSFAHHLSSYLTAWGMSVSHMSTEVDADGEYELLGNVPEPPLPTMDHSLPSIAEGSSSTSGAQRSSSDPAFILIDDDVSVLRSRLQKIKAEQAYPLNLHGRRRPSLASHHRPRSSPQVARVMGMTNNTHSRSTPHVVIVHFTSLSNFKLVKDAIQSVLAPQEGSFVRVPEVIVIPKPAGPRRFLTALHTAVTHPVVDPFFMPTATSPMSPGLHSINPFFSLTGPPKSPGARSTASGRTVSDRSTKSPKEFVDAGHTHAAPPSPLGQSDNMEYFSDAASKLGGSPATGLLIQSPDGQPTGIFFHPKPRYGNAPRSSSMERSRTQESPQTRQRSYSRDQSSNEGSGSKVNSIIVSPPAARPSARPTPSDTADVTGGSSRNKHRGASSSFTEDNPPQSIEQNLAASGVIPSDIVAPQRFLTRRQSQQSVQPANSPPPSPQAQPSGKAGNTRRGSRRSTMDSQGLTSTKKGKGGPDGNIVPPISVLIVDDNPINQTILSTFMRKKKIKYDVAKNGEEAVHKWRSGVFHLILMDIQMPVMDGIQATKEIRRMEKVSGAGGFPSTPQSEGQRTPSEASNDSRNISTPPYRSSVIIVALTASSLQADRVAALAAGCNDFLTKPVSLEWLNSKIIEWGSIKALQMWADIRPEVVKSISSGQNAQAQQVARRLHVPEGRSATPGGERPRSTSMAGRRIAVENTVERAQHTPPTDASASAADPPKHTYPAMTASEAALGLASAHRPQLPADGGRVSSDAIQTSVIPPTPEAAVVPSSVDAAVVGTPTIPGVSAASDEQKEDSVPSVSADCQPGPPHPQPQ
ncbi:hypothetical protein BC835DRAFT_1415718 [Cytidiella melzeri]|nr:hypothetical protein BC835DRAFT_1415718 [Cytidiella melzeri]